MENAVTNGAGQPMMTSGERIDRLVGEIEVSGRTVVALRMYWKKGRVKVELGLGKGKDAGDKRADLKKRATDRETDREIADFQRRR